MKPEIFDYVIKRLQLSPPPVTEKEVEAVKKIADILDKHGFPIGKLRLFEDMNCFCVLSINGAPSLRFSAYYPIFTIDEAASNETDRTAEIIDVMQAYGFIYIDGNDLGGGPLRRIDLMENNLCSRLFGYYSD